MSASSTQYPVREKKRQKVKNSARVTLIINKKIEDKDSETEIKETELAINSIKQGIKRRISN